jgi:putative glutamine amidotransferase
MPTPSQKPLVAVVSDIRTFDNYTWHAAPQQYLEAAMQGAGVMPLIVPSFGEAVDYEAILAHVHGVLVTGSRSNVHPERYGAAPS